MRAFLCLAVFIPSIAFAQLSGGGITLAQSVAAAPVQSVSSRTGAVVLDVSDISGAAPLASPTFTGSPTVPGYLTSAVAASTYLTSAALTNYAPIASPTFTGTVTAPTVSVTSALTTVNFTHSGPEMDTTLAASSPLTGATVTLVPGTTLVTPSGALLALTINLPSCTAGANGQIVRMATSQAVTTLTTTATAGAILGTLAGLTGGQGIAYICRGSNTTWYRLY